MSGASRSPHAGGVGAGKTREARAHRLCRAGDGPKSGLPELRRLPYCAKVPLELLPASLNCRSTCKGSVRHKKHRSVEMKSLDPTRRLSIAMLAILLLAVLQSDGFGQGANQPPKAPAGLAWVTQPNGPQMEAEFTNNTERQLAIVLGKQKCRLKPGESRKVLFQNQQPLKVAEVFPEAARAESRFRMRYEGVLIPQANRGNLAIPKG